MENREKVGIIIIGVLTALLVFFVGMYFNTKKNLTIEKHNVIALNDTVTQVKLKNGELLSYKNSLILENRELEEYLGISRSEVKELERKLNEKLIYISKLEGEFRTDTIIIVDSISRPDSSTYRYSFDKCNEYYHISGFTDVTNNIGTTTITDNIVNLKLKVGLDENWKIFVKSDNPYVSFDEVDGALLDKDVFLKQQKKTHWSVGVQVGFGAQYGVIHNTFDIGPYVGIGCGFGWNF